MPKEDLERFDKDIGRGRVEIWIPVSWLWRKWKDHKKKKRAEDRKRLVWCYECGCPATPDSPERCSVHGLALTCYEEKGGETK